MKCKKDPQIVGVLKHIFSTTDFNDLIPDNFEQRKSSASIVSKLSKKSRKSGNIKPEDTVNSLLGFHKFYSKFMDVYGREGVIDEEDISTNFDERVVTGKSNYFSPIQQASKIKLKWKSPAKSMVQFENEPMAKSPQLIPKSEVFDPLNTQQSDVGLGLCKKRGYK